VEIEELSQQLFPMSFPQGRPNNGKKNKCVIPFCTFLTIQNYFVTSARIVWQLICNHREYYYNYFDLLWIAPRSGAFHFALDLKVLEHDFRQMLRRSAN